MIIVHSAQSIVKKSKPVYVILSVMLYLSTISICCCQQSGGGGFRGGGRKRRGDSGGGGSVGGGGGATAARPLEPEDIAAKPYECQRENRDIAITLLFIPRVWQYFEWA